MNKLVRLLSGVLLLQVMTAADAVTQGAEPWHLLSAARDEITTKFEKALDGLSVQSVPFDDTNCEKTHYRKLIILGYNALTHALRCRQKQKSDAHWVVGYIPEALWLRIQEENAHVLSRLHVDVIVVDPPPLCQLALANIIYPKARRIAAISSRYTENWNQTLQRFSKVLADDRRLNVVQISDENFAGTFLFTIKRHDLVIIPIEPKFFNGYSARNILLASYRQRTPLIGNTPEFVRAGVLASCVVPVSAQNELARHVIESQPHTLTTNAHVRFAETFDIVVNTQVARAYALQTLDPKILRSQVSQQLKRWQNNERGQVE